MRTLFGHAAVLASLAALSGCGTFPGDLSTWMPSSDDYVSYDTYDSGDPYLDELRRQNDLLERQVEAQERAAARPAVVVVPRGPTRRDPPRYQPPRRDPPRTEAPRARYVPPPPPRAPEPPRRPDPPSPAPPPPPAAQPQPQPAPAAPALDEERPRRVREPS